MSKIDGAEKLIFRTKDDHLIETVILPESGRTAVCISSQVGCACYCSFCATGLMGFSRNLSVAEIGSGAVGESADQARGSVGSQCGVYGYGGAVVKSGSGVRGGGAVDRSSLV